MIMMTAAEADSGTATKISCYSKKSYFYFVWDVSRWNSLQGGPRQDSSVGIETGYGLDIGVQFRAVARDFSLLHSAQTASEAHPGYRGPFLQGQSLSGVNLNTHVHLGPRSRMVEPHSPIFLRGVVLN
jgi:hypothetical protein